MERLRSLRKALWMTTALMAVEVMLLCFMVRPATGFVWITVGVIAILGFFLARLSFGLIKELEVKEQNKSE